MTSLSTGHSEMIHDAQLDYYGQKLATASSDRTIKIFEVVGEQQNLLAELKGHDGPVWQVAWAHPKFGTLVASCSYDGNVIVWKETQPNSWQRVYTAAHKSSVNSVCWAPHAFGTVLAAACADGSVSVFTLQNNNWVKETFHAHTGGCNAVSWGPDFKAGALLASTTGQNSNLFQQRLVTGGCDNFVKIWSKAQNGWQEYAHWSSPGQNCHQDWVRDVAWAPSMGLPSSTIASCSDDKTVLIWSEDGKGQWQKAKTLNFDCKIWRLSWSLMGNILAVSQGDNQVTLWKEGLDGNWQNLSTLKEEQKSST